MSTLLVLRERLRKLYAEHTIFIVKILQFIMGLLLFWMINSNIGFMETASSVFCTAGLAVIVLLTAWSNYRDLEPKRKKGRDRLLFLGTTVLAVIMLVVPAYLAAPAGVLFGICFLM